MITLKNSTFLAKGNKFLHIADYKQAQLLMNTQLDTRFAELLQGFLPIVFPMMPDILGLYLSYCWRLWQSEWTTDLIFDSPDKPYANSTTDVITRVSDFNDGLRIVFQVLPIKCYVSLWQIPVSEIAELRSSYQEKLVVTCDCCEPMALSAKFQNKIDTR